MKHLTYTLVFFTLLLFSACGDSPITPIGGEGEQPGLKAANFGLVEVTISGIGSDKMTATAQPYVSNVAKSLSQPSGSGGTNDGTIQLESLSNGSFTVGDRPGGYRYIWATFEVSNADKDGNSYSSNRENLTFLGADTDATIEKTAISNLRLFGGTDITGPAAKTIAEATIPTGAPKLASDGKNIASQYVDVLQLYTEAQVDALDLNGTNATDVFPYGFITQNPTKIESGNIPGRRYLDVFKGVVTFAFKIPLQSQATLDPFEISAVFLPVDDSETTITQSFEEQNTDARKAFLQRVKALEPSTVKILPGSTYRGRSIMMCGPVRFAGAASDAINMPFPALPGFASLEPAPYDGSAHRIGNSIEFKANFIGNLTGANDRRFVVHGRQSGTQLGTIPYFDKVNSVSKIHAQTGTLSVGEVIEVSLIRGFGDCQPTVARYRVGPTGGSGNFVANQYPLSFPNANYVLRLRDLSLGDVNKDGYLDAVMLLFETNNSVMIVGYGEADGSFRRYPDSYFHVASNPNNIELGDLNEDGVLDAMVNGRYDYEGMSVSFGVSHPSNEPFESSIQYSDYAIQVSDMAFGDMNGDGALDMVTLQQGINGNGSDGSFTVMLGDGTGEFLEAPGGPHVLRQASMSVAIGDVNNDGITDVVAVSDGSSTNGSVSVSLGDGTGNYSAATFTTVGVDPRSVALGDLNNDGYLDIVTANRGSDNVTILTGNGTVAFSSSAPIPVGDMPTSVALGDLNNDTYLDIVTANITDPLNEGPYDSDTISIIFSNNGGAFSAAVAIAVGNEPHDLDLGDVDADGDLDIVTTNTDTNDLSVLLNQ